MQHPRMTIFDWDGTLYDSDFLLDLAIEEILIEQGQNEALKSVEAVLYQQRSEPVVRSLHLPVRGRADLIRAIQRRYLEHESRATLFPGVADLIASLKGRGDMLGVVTGRDRASFDAAIKKTGLSNAFDATVCATEAQSKPSPAGIQMIIGALRPARSVSYVGNEVADHRAAQAAKVEFMGVHFCSRTRCVRPPELHSVHMSVPLLRAALYRND